MASTFVSLCQPALVIQIPSEFQQQMHIKIGSHAPLHKWPVGSDQNFQPWTWFRPDTSTSTHWSQAKLQQEEQWQAKDEEAQTEPFSRWGFWFKTKEAQAQGTLSRINDNPKIRVWHYTI
jgi:hypothetical protein